MDIAIAGQHLDLTSLIAGGVILRTVEAAIIAAIKPLPSAAVGLLRKRVQALAAEGKLDAPTARLLKSWARATFIWADEELPDSPGPEKMAAAVDRLALVPYIGILVRADREGAKAILQAAYDAIDAEAKEQAIALEDKTDASKTPPASPEKPPAAPEAAPK